MIRKNLRLIVGCSMLGVWFLVAQMATGEGFSTEKFYFEVDGKRLSGLLDTPRDRNAVATVVYVHGYGSTDVVAGNWYYDMRKRFSERGLNFLIWDKPGCGESEGSFDIDQPVASSAEEVLAAIETLRKRDIPGLGNIGLWGISRAGWIAPLAIAKDPSIAFWISVSGTDDKENFKYLLDSNFRIEGRSESETETLVDAWQRSFDALSSGGSYSNYIRFDRIVREDPFFKYLTGGGGSPYGRIGFWLQQRKFASGELQVDEETGLLIYVPNFSDTLSKINCPVLAIFGEKDSNVDWAKTKALYEGTIGQNSSSSLEVVTFPDGNHVIRMCETGGVREMNETIDHAPYCDGYYESQFEWLERHGFAN